MSRAVQGDRDLDDEHLRRCPACGAEWPTWDPRHGENPLIEHLASEEVGPEHFGLSPAEGER